MKYLHIGDLHLDAPFSSSDPITAKKRRENQLNDFRSAVEYADGNSIPLILVAGDLFDTRYSSAATGFAVCDIIGKSKARFVIAPGNHDPMTPESIYKKIPFPENAYIFDGGMSRISFPDLDTDVYGYAFTDVRMEASPLCPQETDPGRINILLAHGDVSRADSPYCPLTAEGIASVGCDYAALGHRHKRDPAPLREGNTFYAYCGSLIGRSFDECGEKGGLVVDICKDNGLSVSCSFVRFSTERYECAEVDVGRALGDGDASEAVCAYIAENALGDCSLRVALRGFTAPEVTLSPSAIERMVSAKFPGITVEIRDGTSPGYDFHALECDLSIRGAFYRSLSPRLFSADERERRVATKALRLGMDALIGT